MHAHILTLHVLASVIVSMRLSAGELIFKTGEQTLIFTVRWSRIMGVKLKEILGKGEDYIFLETLYDYCIEVYEMNVCYVSHV